MVSSFKRPLIQFISLVRWVSLNDPRNLVNFAGQPPGPDQLRKLLVNKTNRNPKLISHRLQLNSLIGLQKLRVDDHPGLPHKIPHMVPQIRIAPHHLDNPHKSLEESLVPTVIERINILLDLRQLHQIDNSLRRLNDLLFELRPRHIQQPCQNTIGDQFLVRHYLRTVEGRYHLHEQRTRLLKIPDDETVYPLVDLQLVLPLPVTPLLQQSIALVDIVFLHQVYRYQLECDVHLLTYLDRLF